MAIIIDPSWNFKDALQAIYNRYAGYGVMSTGLRTAEIQKWGNVVGKSRAITGLSEFIRESGSKKNAANRLGMSTSTLKKIEVYFNNLPEIQGIPEEKKYDVALSFAGEDREYVEKVANLLKKQNISVFYDTFETSELWGKNLVDHLTEIYQEGSNFVVMFISESYKNKMWTNVERKAAFSKSITINRDYILPARFDDTEIPGLLPTVGYINLNDTDPDQLVSLIIEKLTKFGYFPKK